MAPLTVVEGSSRRAGARVAAAVAVARAEGWTIVEGWAAPLTRDRVVCTGWIRTTDDARRALLAAVAGAGLVVGVSADSETLDRLVDDLRRLGPVEQVAAARHRSATPAPVETRAADGMTAPRRGRRR